MGAKRSIVVVIHAFTAVSSQGNCFVKPFGPLQPDAQEIQVDLALLPSTTGLVQSTHSPANIVTTLPIAQASTRSESGISATSSSTPTSERSPVTLPESTIVPRQYPWMALADPSFEQNYALQVERNDWIVRLAGQDPLPNNNTSCDCDDQRHIPQLRCQAQAPLIAWARLRKGTTPTLSHEILRIIQQKATIAFSVSYIFPPFLLQDILLRLMNRNKE